MRISVDLPLEELLRADLRVSVVEAHCSSEGSPTGQAIQDQIEEIKPPYMIQRSRQFLRVEILDTNDCSPAHKSRHRSWREDCI